MASEERNYIHPDLDKINKSIGRGGFGEVLLVKHEGKKLARKGVKYNNKNESELSITIYEIEILKELKHKNVVEFKDYYIDTEKNAIYIYTEYYEKGDLLGVIHKKKKRSEYFSFDVFIYLNLIFLGNNELYKGFD